MTSATGAPSIHSLDTDDFDDFIVYLNDHVSDNGAEGTPYFQPMPKGGALLSEEKAASFLNGMQTAVGNPGWRRFWVARDGERRIVGHVDLRARPETYTDHRCLLGMGVHRDHRRRGVGRRLLARAECWAQQGGQLEWIDLQVLSSNESALRLYRRAGFEQTGETADMFRIDGLSLSWVSMSRWLKQGDSSSGKSGCHPEYAGQE